MRGSERTQRGYLAAGLVVLVVFALYAPALKLMLLHDDAIIVQSLSQRTLLNIFQSRPGDDLYRPISYLPWLLVRDVFGWFNHSIIYFWNVAAHILNTALVMALMRRMNMHLGSRSVGAGVLAGLMFGLFPFSYQAILWASAVVHPLMVLFSLGAVHAYLAAQPLQPQRSRRIRLALSGGFILLACLSHELGFISGAWVLLAACALAMRSHTRLKRSDVALSLMALAYPVVYRIVVSSQWAATNTLSLESGRAAFLPNLTYFMQGMVGWLEVLLRSRIGLDDARYGIVAVLFGVAVLGGAAVLHRAKRLMLGAVGIGGWLSAAVPLCLFLPEGYIAPGPRLLYVSSVGIAIFWAAVVSAWFTWLNRKPIPKRYNIAGLASAALVAGLLSWGAVFITTRLNETARLTPALQHMDDDLRQSQPSDHVLIINPPMWNTPNYPPFILGAQGIVIYAEYAAPATWLASASGTWRETVFARHDASMTQSGLFEYTSAGSPIDDAGLGALIRNANYIYRFEYDLPGLRVRQVGAVVNADPANDAYVSRVSNGPEQALLKHLRATRCLNTVTIEATWSGVHGFTQPMGIFSHAYDAAGQRVAAADQDLLDGYLALEAVPADKTISETRVLKLPSSAMNVKDIHLGVFAKASGQRLRAWRNDGTEWAGNEIVIPVESESCK